MKGISNVDAAKISRRRILEIIEGAGLSGIKPMAILLKLKMSSRTLYKHLKRMEALGAVERMSNRRYRKRLPPQRIGGPPTGLKNGFYDSLMHLKTALYHKGEHPQIPAVGMLSFESLIGSPDMWYSRDQQSGKLMNWVEEMIAKTEGQPEILFLFPNHFKDMCLGEPFLAEQSPGLEAEQLFLYDLPCLSYALLYRMIAWNAKAKKLQQPTDKSQRLNWLKKSLDFDCLFCIRVNGKKIAEQL